MNQSWTVFGVPERPVIVELLKTIAAAGAVERPVARVSMEMKENSAPQVQQMEKTVPGRVGDLAMGRMGAQKTGPALMACK